MQISVRKSILRVTLGIIVFVGLTIGVYFLWTDVVATWRNAQSWRSPYIGFSAEGKKEVQISEKDNTSTLTIPSCSLYEAANFDSTTTIKCSLYPSRYFSALYWMKDFSGLEYDFLLTIPKQVKMTHNTKPIQSSDIPTLASQARQVSITLFLQNSDAGLTFFREFEHYFKTRNGNTELMAQTLQQVDIIDISHIKKDEYMQLLFPQNLLTTLRSGTEEDAVDSLLNRFKQDASDSDKSPHFTEGLVYGLYLLAENDPGLVQQILARLEQKVLPFRQPVFEENESQTTKQDQETSVSAPHTKFPLCPIQAVIARKWDSMSIKLFLSYQRFQPKTNAVYTLLEQKLYDKEGNLLQYENMVDVDDFCRQVIETKAVGKIEYLHKWYTLYVKQYFVYEPTSGEGSVVMEGSDLLRGVVIRGLAQDTTVAKENISLESVRRSLFDGILWVYLYGK